MSYSDYTEDYVNEEQFHKAYSLIKNDITEGKPFNTDKCTIILGGQPGAGKSNYYAMKDDLLDYVAINGDEYRRYHPNYINIVKTDPEHYAERTQSFSNKMVERLISDLGKQGYNLIIEGTLRNPQVPIKTCEYLQGKGYNPELVVVACDAEKAWQSTLTRASLLKSRGIAPRLVPIDIYNNTVNQIPDSLDQIEKKGCFSNITVVNRDGSILYRKNDISDVKASDILRRELNLDNWNRKLPMFEKEFIQEKIAILQNTLNQGIIHDIYKR